MGSVLSAAPLAASALQPVVRLLAQAPDEVGRDLATQFCYAGSLFDVRAERYADVLRLRYFRDPPATRSELAQRWGVTTERVRQIEARLLRMLRHPSRRAVARALGAASPLLEVAVFGHHDGYCLCGQCAGWAP